MADSAKLKRPLRRGEKVRRAAFLIGCVLAFLAGVIFRSHGPGGDGIVASFTTPDGTECLVIQKWNGWDEILDAYTVTFYFRRPGGRWGWNDVNLLDTRWRHTRMTYDKATDSVQIFRGEQLCARFDMSRNRFILLRGNGYETDAPLDDKDPPFLPRAAATKASG